MTDWTRLSKLAGMLGSQNDGERVNAARLLEQALNRAGLTFADFSQRIADGSPYSAPRTVYVEKPVEPNPAGVMAQKIIDTAKGKLTGTERVFLQDIIRQCAMTRRNFDLSMFQAKYLMDLEKIYVLRTMQKATPSGKRGPVPKDVLDDLGLGKQAGSYGGPEPRVGRTRNPYKPRARVVDDEMPDAREEVETRGNTEWAARKVDLDFDDELGF